MGNVLDGPGCTSVAPSLGAVAGAFLTLGPLETLSHSTQTLPRAYSYGRSVS